MSDPKTKTEKTYPTGALLESKALAGYQPDFARAILTKNTYTVREAKEVLEKYLKGGKT